MANPRPLRALEARLRRRLRGIDGSRDAGNGTPLADAAATLIAADAAQARVEPGAASELADAELSVAMATVADVLMGRTAKGAALPFGTEVRGLDDGLVSVGDQHYVLVDCRTGMTREHEAPVSQVGPNLVLLLGMLRAETADRACGALGEPRAVTEESAVDEHLLRFAPCPVAGGVILEIPIERPIHQLPHDALDGIVRLTAEAMEVFWSQRKALARRVRSTRSIFAAEADSAGIAAAGLRLAEFTSRPFEFVDSHCETIREKLSLYIGLASFDAALRPAVTHWLIVGEVSARRTMLSAIREHGRALDRIERGGERRIDGLAAAIASATPGGPAAVLKLLSRRLAIDVALPISPGRLLASRLYWRDGTIKTFQYHNRRVQFDGTEVTLRDFTLPDTIEAGLLGRRIDEIVALPMPCPLRVREVERPYAGTLLLLLHDVTHPVDLAAGAIG